MTFKDWASTRNSLLPYEMASDDVEIYQAGYNVAMRDTARILAHTSRPAALRHTTALMDVLYELCELNGWESAYDRGRLQGYSDVYQANKQ